MKKIVFAVALVGVAAGCGDSERQQEAPLSMALTAEIKIQCVGAAKTGVAYRPLREAVLRSNWQEDSPPLINERASSRDGPQFQRIDGSTPVVEECTVGQNSFVRVTAPEHLVGRFGWVNSTVLTQKNNPNDQYEGLIAEYLLRPLPDTFFEGGHASWKSSRMRLESELENAARMAIDSGQCDYVEGSMPLLSESDSTNIRYLVDCSNKKQFTVTSGEIAERAILVSNDTKAISPEDALKRCKALAAPRLAHLGRVSFRDVLGASYYKAPTVGNVRFTLDYQIITATEKSLEGRAVCVFGSDGSEEVRI